MPKLAMRKPTEVPAPSRAKRAVRERQLIYEGFIRQLNGQVGELELAPDEQIRSTKVRLRRAATRLGIAIETWDVEGRVYFKAAVGRRRPRAPKSSAGS